MDINQLPTELLQEIMSYMCFKTLKSASLVCRRWYQASEKFIIRNGQLLMPECAANHLNVIQNCVREYQTVCIARIKEWSYLQAVSTECSKRFPKVRKLNLVNCLHDNFYRFYNVYRDWMEQCESFEMSIDNSFTDRLICGSEDFVLTFPNLKTLQWSASLYGHRQKMVTINAPNLERVHIDEGSDASAVVRIPNCDHIKFIRYVGSKHFGDTFVGNVSNVETMIVDVYSGNYDISYLGRMRQLQFLKLTFSSASNGLQDIETMHQCTNLKVLSIEIQDFKSKKGTLNLKKAFENFIKLETLDLQAIDLKANGSLQAKQLQFLKLREVTCSKSAIYLHSPNLKVLSVPVNILNILKLNECDHLEELYLDLESSNLKQSFERTAVPFILSHKNLKKFVMFRSIYKSYQFEDNAKHDCKDLGLEHVELCNLNISIDFFRMLSKWKSLKRLTISGCAINLKCVTYDTVYLPGVQQMSLHSVQVRGAVKKGFPLTIGRACQLHRKRIAWLVLYSTKKQLDSHYRRYNPFNHDKIDPLHW